MTALDCSPPADRRRPIVPRRQLRAALPLLVVWALGTGFLWLALHGDEVPAERLLLDPSGVAGMPWYTGLVSNLGVLAWTVAAVSAGLGGFIARLDGREAASRYLFHSCSLGALLTLDDMLRLHSDLLPALLGISKTTVLLIYVVLIVIWFFANLREIRRTRVLLLYGAIAALATSLVMDTTGLGGAYALIAEDAPKFLGVLAWATYFTLTSTDIARSVVVSGRARSPADATEPTDRDPAQPHPGSDQLKCLNRRDLGAELPHFGGVE